MHYVIVYDIPEDKIRNRVAEWLEEKGTRVQESVFECRRPPGEAGALAKALRKIMSDSAGNVRVYQVCSNCLGQSVGVGDVVHPPEEKGYYIH